MAQKKFYAVKNGKKTGIFTTWADCEENVKGIKGAVYKSFPTKTEAEEFLGLKSESKEEKIIPPKDTAYAYVDGSFNINTSIYGYGVVVILDNGKELTFNGNDNNQDVASMRNVAGELKGAMIAMQYAYNNNINKLVIFHDYEGVS